MKVFEKVPPRYRNPQCFRICMIAKAYSEEKTVEAMEYCIKVDRCNAIELVAFLIARYGEQKAKRALKSENFYYCKRRSLEIAREQGWQT